MKTPKSLYFASILNQLAEGSELNVHFSQYNKPLELRIAMENGIYKAELSTTTTKIKPAFVASGNTDTVVKYLNKRITMPKTIEVAKKVLQS
jgi:hypothetical protein